MFDDNQFANKYIRKLISFCGQGKNIICYGAGRYANVVVSALRYNKIHISDCLITGEINSKKYFIMYYMM